MLATRLGALALLACLSGCALSPFKTGEPEQAPSPPPAASTSRSRDTQAGSGPVLSSPPAITAPSGDGSEVIAAPQPRLPAERPARRMPQQKLSPATQALVNQATAQRKRGDLPGAAISLDRALRIEPSNPLLWIEMGKLRLDQRNYAQAESMGRKALSMSVGDGVTQAAAWTLIADSLQARGRNLQAQEAREKATSLTAATNSLLPPASPP
jgi:tetratricopeptide (TPR) repeat protein